MRHKKKGRTLGRKTQHRNAMYRNMVASLLQYGYIKTTLPKAKELRKIIEPMITRAGKDNLANRSVIFSRIRNKQAVACLFEIVGPMYLKRPGGYTRILKSGYRAGDKALMAVIQLIDYEPWEISKKKKQTSSSMQPCALRCFR